MPNIELTVTEDSPIELNVLSDSLVRLGVQEQIINSGGGGMSDDVKQALLDLIEHLAFIDADGQDYYDALYAALYPPVELDYITCVYTQSGAVYDTDSLDDLKPDLVVTAHNSDGTSETVNTYTLSGTLTAGTSTITVSYGGKTTTFNVTVTEWLASITAVYTQSGEVYTDDTLDSLKANLVVTANYGDGTSDTVSTYTLSGSLTSGTSTITVTYLEKTTTFNVTVTAPLYSIPDFAEQSVTKDGKTGYLKKVDGIFYYRGTYTDVIYVSPNGTISVSGSSAIWFSTLTNKPLLLQVDVLTWENPNSQALTFATKFKRADNTSNVYSATFSMPANQSGTNGDAKFESSALTSGRDIANLGVQVYGTGNYANSAPVSFKLKLFVDGVRYL